MRGNRMKQKVRKDFEDFKREMRQQQDRKYAAVEDCELLRDPNFMWIHRALEKSGWSVSAMIEKIGRAKQRGSNG